MKLDISYKVQNWKQYNEALRQRGNLQIWFVPEVFATPHKTGSRDRPQKYSTGLIELAHTIRFLFHLPLKATQGFIDSLLRNHDIHANCCDYSLLSKRASEVLTKLRALRKPSGKIIHLAIDSTGLQVYGDGEWKVRIHGTSKRRTWRKMHLAIDAESHRIVGALLTKSNMHDGRAIWNANDAKRKISS